MGTARRVLEKVWLFSGRRCFIFIQYKDVEIDFAFGFPLSDPVRGTGSVENIPGQDGSVQIYVGVFQGFSYVLAVGCLRRFFPCRMHYMDVHSETL